ncbi:MAG: low temperature requirement protein A [Nocardiopsaceae bacterium]|nr:low temperature requirement protein A [Nocardiopsaceae bacterium]
MCWHGDGAGFHLNSEAQAADRPPPGRGEAGVLTIELFFDLVFVFTITQLTSLLVAETSWTGLARVVLIFGNVWWMYDGYAWLTNAVPPVAVTLRVLMLVGMIGFLVVALAIPRAFGSSGVAFGVGYLIVTALQTGLFLRSSHEGTVRAIKRLGLYDVMTAGLILAAGFTGGTARWVLWTAAFLLHWAFSPVAAVRDVRIRVAHFVERHSQIVLIATGESVVAVGAGIQHERLRTGLIVTSILGLVVVAALWWLYFDGEDVRARHALDAAPATRRPWLALLAFGYAFVPLLGGITVLAAGIKETTVRSGVPATGTIAWLLGAGTALYIAAVVSIRAILRSGPLLPRLGIAAAALVTVIAGLQVSPELQLGLLAVVVAGGIGLERLSGMSMEYWAHGQS